jgi:hypothetical protein
MSCEMRDESDVQDSPRAVLKLQFGDIRPEESMPGYAGSQGRMEFPPERGKHEAACRLSRITSFGRDVSCWALSGLRRMLGGQANDPAVSRRLTRLRDST